MYQYVHGGDIYSAKNLTGIENILDFSVNVNPLGLPETVKKSIVNAVKDCDQYPDPFCRELTAALSVYESTDKEHIFCANGASEIIFRLALALKPKKALLLAPTFADYEKALKTVSCEISYYLLEAENDFSVQPDFLDRISNALDMVFICNPNNPTGQLCPVPFLKKVLARCLKTNTVVLIDECFIDFVDQPEHNSVRPYLETYRNLVILKAFTKLYAIPGLRLGYAMTSNHKLLEQLRLSGQDWSVSTIAQAAGISALKEEVYRAQTKIVINMGREFLIAQLQKMGFQIFGSKANYVFFKTAVSNLEKKLISRGILIRSCANYINLSSEYYRITVKDPNDNNRLIAVLKDVMMDESPDKPCQW